MSTRDSTFSYIHLEDPNHVLYMEKWQDDPIPFDYIDTQALFESTSSIFPHELLEDEEDGELPIPTSGLGAKVFKDRKFMKERTWQDLAIYERFHPGSKRDHTLLKALYTSSHDEVADSNFLVADFLSNGFEVENVIEQDTTGGELGNDSFMGNPGDFSINSAELAVPSGSFSMNRNPSNNSTTMQTPRPVRRISTSDRNFQTPITRIIR